MMEIRKQFSDDLDIYVFTTHSVIEKVSPIVFISHDEEGDWQFFGIDGPFESEARIILLAEMIELDPSILEVADLPLGFKAFRENRNSPWRTGNISPEND